ncbi:hypothetical protein [Lewinella sp. IMCC34183]|uniref:hypothetical protein n=1 Tax=Lewinella sp. IMCC34183 TaxID=2248762 RepID=UPI000E27E16F|nr:hypothetical protein [Lewinella sp. IMCC34183]
MPLAARLFPLFLFLLAQPADAQFYTPPEAVGLADSLYAAELLSATGRDSLQKLVRTGELPIYTPRAVRTVDYGDSISAGQVLGFLQEAYSSAYLHRLGIGVRLAVAREWQQRSDFNADLLQSPALEREIALRVQRLPGFQLELAAEAAARSRGQLPPRSEGLSLYPFGNATYTDTLVAPGRSVFGYDLRQTLAGLQRTELISADSLTAYTARLDTGRLFPDYILVRSLATAAGEREARHLRTAARLRALDFLQFRGVVPELVADSLRRHPDRLGAVDNEMLYTYVEPRFTLSLPRPDGPMDFADDLLRNLQEYDPRFATLVLRAEPAEEEGRFYWVARSADTLIDRSVPQYAPFEAGGMSWFYAYEWEVLLATINAFLDADNAPYRLYAPRVRTPDDPAGPVEVPLLPLTSPAARALTDYRLADAVSGLRGPNARAFLSPAEVMLVRDSLRQLGYFAGLSDAEWETGGDCTEAGTVEGLAGLLSCFPGRPASETPGARVYRVSRERYGGAPFRVRMAEGVADFLLRRFPGALEVEL